VKGSLGKGALGGILAAIVGASLFGMLGPLSRFGADVGVTGVAFTAWRATIGAIFLGAVLILRGQAGPSVAALRGLDRRGAGSLAAAALMGLGLNAALFSAFGLIPIALALMLFYAYPAAVALADIALGRERATPIRMGALAVSMGGVVLVLIGGMAGNSSPINPLGILLGLTAAVCQAVFVTISRHGYRSVPTAAATMVILVTASLGAIGLALLVGQADGLTAPFRDARAWVPVLFAGIAAAAVASLLFLTAIRRIGGTRTGVLMLMEPVVGVFLAGVLLGEALTLIQAVGAALVLGGALTLQRASEPDLEPVVETAAGPVV